MYTLSNGMTSGLDQFILADGLVIPTEAPGAGNTHVLMIGPSGSGKTTGGFIPNIMQLNSSMVIIDQKGALYRQLAPGLRSAGYSVLLLDFVKPSRSSYRWNPFAHLKSQEEVTAFCRRIITAYGTSKDPYWNLAAQLLLEACYEACREMRPWSSPTMGDIVELQRQAYIIEGGGHDNRHSKLADTFERLQRDVEQQRGPQTETELSSRMEDLDERILHLEEWAAGIEVLSSGSEGEDRIDNIRGKIARLECEKQALMKGFHGLHRLAHASEAARNSRAYELWKAVSTTADTTFQCILGEFAASMEPFASNGLLDLMGNGDQVDFKRLGLVSDGMGGRIPPTALFIVCSDTSRNLDPLISVLEGQIFDELVRLADDELDGRLEQPVTFFLDDFASGTPLAGAPKLVANVRSRRIRMVMSVQSLSQLAALYGEDAQSIVTNSDVRLMFGGVRSVADAAILNRGCVPDTGILEARDAGNVIVFHGGKRPVVARRFDPASHPNAAYFEQALMDEKVHGNATGAGRTSIPQRQGDIR